ncbi:hypothetical protein NEOLI_004949 [Neolecta irregularis DAH-3]|uniref:Uncharacterized protein n=1 Tax=Neolecta irregularis (strain DAH-3) TaxID=1198029 RepID=A0A1U7LLL4_NEOID|nr:hypothetical protein NEOLI_004949 [Neolecta irregularis DAH-3]|eukprot:OLL23432.1 hypothetical protein NEOLI_004949 [Neolecta irregularis DAH-3]
MKVVSTYIHANRESNPCDYPEREKLFFQTQYDVNAHQEDSQIVKLSQGLDSVVDILRIKAMLFQAFIQQMAISETIIYLRNNAQVVAPTTKSD